MVKCNGPLRRSLVNSVGFLADAYDLFVIDFVVAILAATAAVEPTVGQKGLIVSSTLAGAVIGQLVFGLAADVVGRRVMFITSALLVILGSLASSLTGFGYTHTTPAFSIFEQLALCRFFLGIGIGAEYPLSATVASETCRADDEEAGAAKLSSAGSTVGLGLHPASDPNRRWSWIRSRTKWRALLRNETNMIACMFSMQGVGMLLSPLMVMLCIGSGMSLEATWRLCLGIGALPSAIVFYFRWVMQETKAFTQSRRILTLADISASPNKEALLEVATAYAGRNRGRKHVNADGTYDEDLLLEAAVMAANSARRRVGERHRDGSLTLMPLVQREKEAQWFMSQRASVASVERPLVADARKHFTKALPAAADESVSDRTTTIPGTISVVATSAAGAVVGVLPNASRKRSGGSADATEGTATDDKDLLLLVGNDGFSSSLSSCVSGSGASNYDSPEKPLKEATRNNTDTQRHASETLTVPPTSYLNTHHHRHSHDSTSPLAANEEDNARPLPVLRPQAAARIVGGDYQVLAYGDRDRSDSGSSNRSMGGSDIIEEKKTLWWRCLVPQCFGINGDRGASAPGSSIFDRSSSRCSIVGQRLLRLFSVFRKYRMALVGTAFCWFLTDVTFYGTGSFKSLVIGQWFDATPKAPPSPAHHQFNATSISTEDSPLLSHTSLARTTEYLTHPSSHRETTDETRHKLMIQAQMACVVAFLSLPGYILSVLFIHKTGLKALQFWGYLAVATTHMLLAVQQWLLGNYKGMSEATARTWRAIQLLVFGLSFLFTNFGPNTVNFILPTTIYPSLVRATCHGFSAAMGKLGGVAGTSLFGVVESGLGLGWLLFFAGCVDIFGAVVTYFFVPADDLAERNLMQAEIDAMYTGLALKEKKSGSVGARVGTAATVTTNVTLNMNHSSASPSRPEGVQRYIEMMERNNKATVATGDTQQAPPPPHTALSFNS